jgi:hypothetical protein
VEHKIIVLEVQKTGRVVLYHLRHHRHPHHLHLLVEPVALKIVELAEQKMEPVELYHYLHLHLHRLHLHHQVVELVVALKMPVALVVRRHLHRHHLRLHHLHRLLQRRVELVVIQEQVELAEQ